jgi:magnesium transporter
MVNTLVLPELREMLADDNRQELREFCCAIHPAGTAEFMEGLSSDEVWQVLRHADPATRSEIFHYFDRDRQLELIRTQPREEIAQLIASRKLPAGPPIGSSAPALAGQHSAKR